MTTTTMINENDKNTPINQNEYHFHTNFTMMYTTPKDVTCNSLQGPTNTELGSSVYSS